MLLFLVALLWIAKICLWFCYSFFYGFYVFVWARISYIDLTKRYGEYVVITGATDGIGFGLAKQFALRGHSLVLIGRNPNKLDKVKETLKSILHPGKHVKTIIADLSSSEASTYRKVDESLQEIKTKIGILVNNAGLFYERPDVFLNNPENEVDGIVKVNIAAVLKITRVVMPYLISNKRGIVINVGSQSAIAPCPLLAVYTASKKFLEYFTDALGHEYRTENIEVQLLQPGIVATRLAQWTKSTAPAFMMPSVDTYAVSAIATIGRSSHTTGYWFHGLMSFVFNFIPTPLVKFMTFNSLKSIRK